MLCTRIFRAVYTYIQGCTRIFRVVHVYLGLTVWVRGHGRGTPRAIGGSGTWHPPRCPPDVTRASSDSCVPRPDRCHSLSRPVRRHTLPIPSAPRHVAMYNTFNRLARRPAPPALSGSAIEHEARPALPALSGSAIEHEACCRAASSAKRRAARSSRHGGTWSLPSGDTRSWAPRPARCHTLPQRHPLSAKTISCELSQFATCSHAWHCSNVERQLTRGDGASGGTAASTR